MVIGLNQLIIKTNCMRCIVIGGTGAVGKVLLNQLAANPNIDKIISVQRRETEAINKKVEVIHPLDPYIKGCSHILWSGSVLNASSTARNAVFYGDKAIDRSPCGTGTSARMAQWVAKEKLKVGDSFIHESIIGSTFEGRVSGLTQVGKFAAVIPSIKGWARVYGYNTIWIDSKDDPYAHGFQVI